jgi:hypothetical protein
MLTTPCIRSTCTALSMIACRARSGPTRPHPSGDLRQLEMMLDMTVRVVDIGFTYVATQVTLEILHVPPGKRHRGMRAPVGEAGHGVQRRACNLS